MLQWRHEGKRETKAFASAADRETEARALAEKRAEHGREILSFDPREWRRWLEFRAVVGPEVDPVLVAQEWKALRQGTTPAGASLTVAEAAQRYVALRTAEKLSPDTLRHIKKHVQERFAARFGARLLREVTPDTVREWLAGLRHGRTGGEVESVTKRHHRKDVAAFFARGVLEGWILRNPCDAVKPPPLDAGEVAVMPVEDVRRLFAENRDEAVVGRLALEAFGGLRYSSAARAERAHLDFAACGIAMPGGLHKSGRRKYRQGQPPNLWAWLLAAPEACWAMTPRQYLLEKGRAFVRAKVPFPHNGLRHSFASYHLAAFKNPPLTAYLMQHTRTATTELYEGIAREAAAKEYFAIVP